MPARKGLLAPQNTFLDTIATRFDGTHSNFVLGNAQAGAIGFPIVYCSDGFVELTGFSRAQIMQKACACKFLYGKDTEDDKKDLIERALEDKTELKMEVKFYKKSGQPFWCLLDVVPIKNEKREVVLFLLSHKDISSTKQFAGINRLPLPGAMDEGGGGGGGGGGGSLLRVGDDSDTESLCRETRNKNLLDVDPEAPNSYNYGQRRRSRAVLYQLSGHYKTEKKKMHHAKINTNSLLSPPTTSIQPLPEYKTVAAKKPRWVISHYGVFKTCWDFLVLMATIYVAIVVPYNAAFQYPVKCNNETLSYSPSSRYGFFDDDVVHVRNGSRYGTVRLRRSSDGDGDGGEEVTNDTFFVVVDADGESADSSVEALAMVTEGNETLNETLVIADDTLNKTLDDQDDQKKSSIVLDVIVETIFIVDILLSFRTTFVNRKGEVVSGAKKIAFHYMRGWFLLDLVAALPFDLLYASEISELDTESSSFIHLLKLTRLLRLARLLQKMDRYSQYSVVILTLLMMTFTLLAHWMACIWYVIGTSEQPKYEAEADLMFPGWLNQLAQRIGLPNGGCVPHKDAYVTALYYTCTSLTTVGFGNVSANTKWEKIFSVAIMLIGALMHATIFGNVTALVQRMYGARKSIYQTKWRDLKDFAILHSVPKQLKRRMQDYFQTMWSLNHGIDPIEILNDYPEELRGDVSLHLHREILSLPIFETASEGCRKLLSLKIKTNFCAPDEYLIHKGDALQSIFYLFNGSMEVLQEGMVVAILGKGDLVGCDISKHLCASKEAASSSAIPEVIVKSSCDVRALTYCDLKCLHIPGLIEVLRLYPEFQDQFAEDILHDLTFNLREGWEADESDAGSDGMDGSSGSLGSSSRLADSMAIIGSPLGIDGSVAHDVILGGIGGANGTVIAALADSVASLATDMRTALSQLQRLNQVHPAPNGTFVRTVASSQSAPNSPNCAKIKNGTVVTAAQLRAGPAHAWADKEVQTDFPAAMLEDYVVKNRKRILKLLGLNSQTGGGVGDGGYGIHLSWNPLPRGPPLPLSNAGERPLRPPTTLQLSSPPTAEEILRRRQIKGRPVAVASIASEGGTSSRRSADAAARAAKSGRSGAGAGSKHNGTPKSMARAALARTSDGVTSAGSNASVGSSERTPLISIDVCSDDDLRDSTEMANFPSGKRHSTGDASADKAFESSLLQLQRVASARNASASASDADEANGARVRKPNSKGSNVSITHI